MYLAWETFLSQTHYPDQHHRGRSCLTISSCEGRSPTPLLFPGALVLPGASASQPYCLPRRQTHPVSPFLGSAQLDWLWGWAQEGRQTPARGGRRRRSETSCFCGLPGIKSIALCSIALPAPGGREAGRGTPGVAAGAGQAPAHPCSCQFWGREIEKLEILFPAGKFE